MSRTSAAERSERKESLTRDKPQTIPAGGEERNDAPPYLPSKRFFLQMKNGCDILKMCKYSIVNICPPI